LLEYITNGSSLEELTFPPIFMSHMFLDPRLARQVAAMHPKLQLEQPVQRPTKRLRISVESRALQEVIDMIDGLVPVRSFSGEMTIPEDEAL
jgi:hypothetical protein